MAYRIIIGVLSVCLASYFLDIGVPLHEPLRNSLPLALGVTVVLGLIHVFIRPVVMLVSLPINILTLGLFTFVVNGMMIMLVTYVLPEFHIPNLVNGIIFALVQGFIQGAFEWLRKGEN